ncbi:MAG: helix-turn-helix domain-containing protein [Actinomycetota bacterium]|nr:helix-turn-helix domain-containing protein [Actinomycetota bacterium]
MPQRSQAHVALGRAIRAIRRDQRISQEELGFRAGLHRTYVGGIERGEKNPSYGNLLKVADALGVATSQLLRDAEEGRELGDLD